MAKRDHILDALYELLIENNGSSYTVADIARKADIAKGGIYYYFKSKNDVFDALVERTYSKIIETCALVLEEKRFTALEKLEILFRNYRVQVNLSHVGKFIHMPQNAHVHQKTLAQILCMLSPIVAEILRQATSEKLLYCYSPDETAEIIVSVFCFLLDEGIFSWTSEQVYNKRKALADLIENGTSAPKNSMAFLYTI